MTAAPATVDTVIVVARDSSIVAEVHHALTEAERSATGQVSTVRRLDRAAAPEGVNVPEMPASDIATVWMTTTANLDATADALDRALGSSTLVDVYQARSTRRFDRGGDQVAQRRLAFLHRRPDIDHATFANRWAVHAGIVAEHQPSIAGYTQHVIVRSANGPADGPANGAVYDACAEFTFTAAVNGQAVPRHSSERGRELLEVDVAGFLGSGGSVSAWVLER